MLHPHIDPETSRPDPAAPPPEAHFFPRWTRAAWPPTREGKIALWGLAVMVGLAAVGIYASRVPAPSNAPTVATCTGDASLALVRFIERSDQGWYADENMAVSPYRGDRPRVFVWIANGPEAVGIHSGHVIEVSPEEGNLPLACRQAIWNALTPVLQRRDQATRNAVTNSLR